MGDDLDEEEILIIILVFIIVLLVIGLGLGLYCFHRYRKSKSIISNFDVNFFYLTIYECLFYFIAPKYVKKCPTSEHFKVF